MFGIAHAGALKIGVYGRGDYQCDNVSIDRHGCRATGCVTAYSGSPVWQRRRDNDDYEKSGYLCMYVVQCVVQADGSDYHGQCKPPTCASGCVYDDDNDNENDNDDDYDDNYDDDDNVL